jgi:DNA-binding transcriptional ArsR family regulator
MEARQVVTALGALAQETRLGIYRALVQAGPGGMAAGAIAEKLDVAAPTLSFHLKELTYAGLINSEQQGRFVVYRADYDAMNALLEFLTANCCRGAECAVDAIACMPVPTAARSDARHAARGGKAKRNR